MFVVMMSFALSNGLLNTSQGVDVWGHFGGFLTGILYSCAYYPPALDYEKKLDAKKRIFSKVILAILIIALTVLLFVKPISSC